MKWPLVLYLVGVLIIPLGAVAIIKDQPYSGSFSFTVPPGLSYYRSFHVINEGRISGDFIENQGQPVTIFVFNQEEFDQYPTTATPTSLFSATDLSHGTFAASISAPGTYYVVVAHGTGYDQAAEPVTLTVKLDGTNLPYLALESLAPIGAAALVSAFVLQKRRNEKLIASLVKEYPNVGLGQGEDDLQILGIAKELCQQLHLAFDPTAVYWIVWVKLGGVKPAPSDQCLLGVKGARRGYVHLPAALRGRLEHGEWRPLLASSLIYLFQPELRRRRRVVNLWVLTIPIAIVLSLILLWISNSFIPLNSSVESLTLISLMFLGFFGAVLPILLSARKVNLVLQKYFLEADILAAAFVGKTQLIQILRKVDSMKLPELEAKKKYRVTIWKRGGVLPWPNITLRIQNLETAQKIPRNGT